MNKVKDWKELTSLTQNKGLIVERVRLTESDIKEMEKVIGVSYPTIKNRLHKISEQLQLVDINPAPSKADILERLNRGELTAAAAAEMLRSV